METSALDKIITGRVQPHIYAFRTGTIPDYLKVGDTYRPVDVRLDEWRSKYDSLEEVCRKEAAVSEEIFFRDFAVHQFFEEVLMLHRLEKGEIPADVYFSNEFFQGATGENVEAAIEDIRDDFSKGGNHYHFYKFDESRIPVETHYVRSENPFKPREEQAQTVKNFMAAKAAGRKNLLMYAVMRFGKSFTSMLCAKEMDAKLVVVICGKTSVEDEWKRNVEIPQNFEGYTFKTRKDLDANHHLISEAKAAGEKIVLFLTLQDLAGDDVKERHKELFENEIDLVIVDETHFGARAPEYGKVLQEEFGVTKATGNKEYQEDDMEALDTTVNKLFHTNLKLHLSGTPYRILMGSEFAPQDVIAFYQFTDIVDAQEKWDRDHLDDPDTKEWDNPYYGFPQMVRFAFNPSDSARKLIKELREKGTSCALSALFQPESIVKNSTKLYKKFKHEKEILELLEVIDGSRDDDELFGFLNYEKIKDGQMCRHIVCVLPFRASCDALQALIENNKEKFHNLAEYQILNIAGQDCPATLKKPEDVKRAVSKAEEEGKKTITLTVNKMLTGSTVEQWDTILFFKDTASPQEYDQAIFRIQNPFVKTMTAPDADKEQKEIKFNMKPQTLLVDFDIDRLFRLQAQKSLAFNINQDVNGNSHLEERMKRELEISPVIVLNKDKLQEVTPNDIMEAISEYSKTRSVADEAKDVPVDMRLMDDPVIKAEIDRQGAISSKEGLSTKPSKGEGDDIEPGDEPGDDTPPEDEETGNNKKKEKDTPEEAFRKRFATYYSRILFYTFLSKDTITNLDELISSMDRNEDNIRIASNLDLKKDILSRLRTKMDGNKLGALEFKIRNLNRLEGDSELSPLERAKTAMRRFSRLSEAEITTPENIARDMVGILPDDCSATNRFLDIAAKQGEFAIALVERFGDASKDHIWSLPTSGVAYEFTRKIYEYLGMPVENIYEINTAFDLIGDSKQELIDSLTNMNFDIIVGNPPYQLKGGSGGTNDAPIFQDFCSLGFKLKPSYACFIVPSRWYSAGRDNLLGEFRSFMLTGGKIPIMNNFADAKMVFPGVEIKGGICYFLFSKNYSGDCNYAYSTGKEIVEESIKLNRFDILVRDPRLANIVEHVTQQIPASENRRVESLISSDTPFGIPTNPSKNKTMDFKVHAKRVDDNDIIIYYLSSNKRISGYLDRTKIRKNSDAIDYVKVFIPKAYGASESFPHQILGIPELAPAGSVCSQTYLYAAFNSELEAKNFVTYYKTKFFRALVCARKITQDAYASTYRFVPLQDFSKPWTDAELYEKYGLDDEEIKFIETTIKTME